MKQDNNFWDNFDRPDGPEGCWLWRGCLTHYGYGAVMFNGKHWTIHRLSFSLAKHPIKPGKMICHTCDIKRCGNPSHLYQGDAKSNWFDGVTRGANKFREGKQNINGKLSESDIKQLFILRNKGKKQREIAIILGVSRSHIANIITCRRRKTFKFT